MYQCNSRVVAKNRKMGLFRVTILQWTTLYCAEVCVALLFSFFPIQSIIVNNLTVKQQR